MWILFSVIIARAFITGKGPGNQGLWLCLLDNGLGDHSQKNRVPGIERGGTYRVITILRVCVSFPALTPSSAPLGIPKGMLVAQAFGMH